jgi:hypothetical protein
METGHVILDISMSLDGFVTGPNADVERGLGVGGERLYDCALGGKTQTDAKVIDEYSRLQGQL